MANATIRNSLIATGSNKGISYRRKVAMLEFDCATSGDSGTTSYEMISADLNKNGLYILDIWGVVTEVMAGSSEDQGVVTVEDESDNSLGTVTATDGASEAVGDVIRGSLTDWPDLSTDDAVGGRTVAAGEFVDARVSQQTAGTPAGRILVGIEYIEVPAK